MKLGWIDAKYGFLSPRERVDLKQQVMDMVEQCTSVLPSNDGDATAELGIGEIINSEVNMVNP